MAKKVTANGKTFTFDDDVTTEQISTAVDEYFSSKKKVETVPSASTSTVTPTTAPSVSEGGTSGLGITPSGSQSIPNLPGRVNPQTLAPINKPIQQVPEPAVATQQKPIAQTPTGEYKPELYTVDPNKANIGKNDLGENLTVGQKDLGTISTYSGQSLGGQTTGFTQGVIANKEEATDLKGKSDYFNKVYAPIAKEKGLALNSDGATMDFYLNYLKDTNPAEYKYNLDKFNSLREAVEEGKNTKNYAGDTKEDQLDLERFEAELITKGTKLKTEAYSGFKRETKATIDNFYKDKVDKFSALSSEGEKKISEVNSVIAELDKFPKNENGEIITDATNRKQVEQLIEKQQKLVGELETIQGGIGELKNDKDFNDAYALMQDADARQEEVSKRYYDLATSNPEAFKNLPEYKALLESKAAAKKKKDYQENVLGVTSFGINEGVSQAVTNFAAKLAYIPKALGADGYGFTDQMYDAANQNVQDFNDEYLTTPTEMDKPIIGDKMSYKYLPGKLAGMATDMALMILTTKGIGGAAGSLPMVSEGVASSIGQVASGYAMSAQGYYEEAKSSGMDESGSRSIASQVALIDSFLELVSPNEKLLSPFKLKDDFAQYGKALAKGATKKKALAETTKRIIEKNIPENIQEQLHSLNAHVMFTSNELSKANESARQSYGQEAAETFLMTTLLTTMMGAPNTITTRNRYDNEALYMAAFAPDKMMSTMSKNLERGLITQQQFDKLSQKITIANEALRKMGDVPQEKKIKTLPAMVEKMEEEAKKKETDTQFQAPIDEKIKVKEEEINQVLNEPSEAEMLDENIAYLQELEAEGIIDDNQKEELDNLLTQKQKTNVQEEKSQAEEVITPVEETAPYVVDATEQRQPIELEINEPIKEAVAPPSTEKVESTPKEEVKSPPSVSSEKSEVKAVELEARFPGGMPRKMEFKDGEWKQNVGGDYTTVAKQVQEQAQAAFDGVNTEVKKEEVKPVVSEVAEPEVKMEMVTEVKKEPKGISQSNKQPVVKPAKVEKVAEEKPIESNKKEDIIDKEEEANVEADKSVKEDEKLIFEIENVNIAKLKAEKDEKMIEQRAVTAMARKDKKVTYSTYTTLKNKIEDVVEGKVKKSKLEGRLQEEVAIQRLADVKKKVKDKLLGEGYNPSQLYSAPGINPKVINDLIDATFNLAEKAIRAGFTIKEAVEKASKLIKSSPAYKAAVRNKQIDEKEFESKISEAVNEETEALKKAFEEEQKKRAEEKALDENAPIEGDIKTGREKERANAKMQKESGKLSEVFDRISDTNKKYKETSLSKSKEYIDTILDDFEANGELISLAEDLLDGREIFLPEVKFEAERLLAGRLNDLAKTKSNDPIAQDDILSKAAKLYTKAMESKGLAATQTAAGRIGNEKISSSPTLLTNMVAEKITEIQKGTITPEEVKKTAEAANEINNIFDMEQMKEQMKKDIMTEFGEKTFGSKEEAERFANFSKSLLTDTNDC